MVVNLTHLHGLKERAPRGTNFVAILANSNGLVDLRLAGSAAGLTIFLEICILWAKINAVAVVDDLAARTGSNALVVFDEIVAFSEANLIDVVEYLILWTSGVTNLSGPVLIVLACSGANLVIFVDWLLRWTGNDACELIYELVVLALGSANFIGIVNRLDSRATYNTGLAVPELASITIYATGSANPISIVSWPIHWARLDALFGLGVPEWKLLAFILDVCCHFSTGLTYAVGAGLVAGLNAYLFR